VTKRKKIKIFLSVALIFLIFSFPVNAVYYNDGDLTYRSYVYNNEDEPVAIPAPFDYYCKIKGEQMGIGSFGEISDIFNCKENNKIYICDCSNNRIVVLSEDYSFEYIISDFLNGVKKDTFNRPTGIYVKNGIIYIADTENSRIVTLSSESLNLIKVYGKPQISMLGEDYTYKPTKLAVGITGQMYVIGKDINSGFISLDSDGEFQSFVGAPEVKTDFIDEIWKIFMTKSQKEALNKSVPTEYNSIAFDNNGFLYATTQSEGVQPVVRLNLQGQDILNYADEYPQGDALYEQNKSAFCDVCVNASGTYFVLDSVSGRVFSYNKYGKMLFAFGKSTLRLFAWLAFIARLTCTPYTAPVRTDPCMAIAIADFLLL